MNPKKGPKVLDPANVCKRCGRKSGQATHECPLANVLPGPGPTTCNCCDACWSRCAMEV